MTLRSSRAWSVGCWRDTQRRIPDFDWLLLISGQDYPAMRMRDVERSLENTDADGSLRCLEVPIDPTPDEYSWVTRCREQYLERRRIPGSCRSIRFPRRRRFGDDMALFIGDTWVNLRATAVRHVLAQVERHPELRRYFEWCGSPDKAAVWNPSDRGFAQRLD